MVTVGSDVADEIVLVESSVLLVRFCVSVSPTIAPDGAVTALKALVPFPFNIPVRVPTPVPPSATARSADAVIAE